MNSKTIQKASECMGQLSKELTRDAIASGQDDETVVISQLLAIGFISNAPNADKLVKLFAGELDFQEE